MKMQTLAGVMTGMTLFLAPSSWAAPLEFDVPSGTSITYPLQITGDDQLIVNSDGLTQGTLILTGNGPGEGDGIGNDYTGTTLLEGGTLQAGLASGTNNAFSPNSDYTLSGTSTLDLNGNSETIGSLSGSATTVVTNSGNGPATLDIDDTNSQMTFPVAYEFDGVITDAGVGNFLSLVKQGNGTLVLTNDNTYNGGTLINGGTLVVGNYTGIHSHTTTALGTGSVVNSAKLETTASLGGEAENVIVGDNYRQTAGGVLFLQIVNSPSLTPSLDSGVAGMSYDTLSVARIADLGGALDLHFQGDTVPSQGQRYVALTAGDPLTTEFAFPTNTNLPAPFYTVTTYNDTFGATQPADSVIVTLLKPFTSFGGLTPNQDSVARNVDNNITLLNDSGRLAMPTGTVEDFFNNIVTGLNISTYSSGALGPALDQLSPQRFEILRNIAFDNYAFDVQSLDDEFARERFGHGGIDTSGFAVNDSALGSELSQIKGRLLAWSPQPEAHGLLSDSAPAALGGVQMTDSKDMKEVTPATVLNKWNGFIDGGVDLGDLDHNIDESHSSYTTGRVRGGVDYLVTENFRVGALLGYSHTDADLDEEGSKAHIDSYTPGIFASYADKQGFYANGLFTYTYNDYTTDRDIVIPGVNRTANGNPSGNQFGADLDGGYEFHKGNWTFAPSAGLTYVNLNIDSFSEGGADAADLSVANQSVDSFRSRLGGSVRYEAKIGSVILTPHLSAFWQHEFLDGATPITSQFEGLPAGSFSVQTVRGDSDNALLDLGIDGEVTKNVTVFLDYETEAGGSSFFGQSAMAGVKLSF